ncbi:Spo11/DNA topoisomerase VI subunit A [Diplogelasinospora grovesii]|uniref:DNA topoisomerase (ATP-hydrolyzing) n=1 Tax=Diplogelasinospora grovesii TaxID=303347 RepID=A0AAN6S634_9PEZI|nr:Spo11/DNA topoisomerase VI subunit A [Diplogelasinospora grovesii]
MSYSVLRRNPRRQAGPQASVSRAAKGPAYVRQASSQSAASSSSSSSVSIPTQDSRDRAIARIEAIIESIINVVCDGVGNCIIPYRTIRSANDATPGQKDDFVKLPSRNFQELERFAALFRILELSHEALLSGNPITKRNIYYQDIDLFKSQSAVDEMVDNLAFTLGLGREDLNIVATDKGLIAGAIELVLTGGSVIDCSRSSDSGFLLPRISTIDSIDFQFTKWLLVIEKEATFRTLVASRFHSTCRAGNGILVTAKGFPDLATRRFLSRVHSARPQLKILALVDFDPYGIAIMRTFKNGSRRLGHEDSITVPSIRWLGIRSIDIMPYVSTTKYDSPEISGSPSSQERYSQVSVESATTKLQEGRPSKKARITAPDSTESVTALTQSDRKRAVEIINDISNLRRIDAVDIEHKHELQKMLMLNIKAEIQAVDDCGDLTDWLNQKLCL